MLVSSGLLFVTYYILIERKFYAGQKIQKNPYPEMEWKPGISHIERRKNWSDFKYQTIFRGSSGISSPKPKLQRPKKTVPQRRGTLDIKEKSHLGVKKF